MKPEEIKAHLAATGWAENASSHYCMDVAVRAGDVVNARPVRVRFNKLTLVVEMRKSVGYGWFRIGGGDYDWVRLEPNGTMRVVTYFFPARKPS